MLRTYLARRAAAPDDGTTPPLTIVAEHGWWGRDWYELLDALCAPLGLDGGRWAGRGLVALIDQDGHRIVPPGADPAAPYLPPLTPAARVAPTPRTPVPAGRGAAPAAVAGVPVTLPLVDRALAAALPTVPALHLDASAWALLGTLAGFPFMRGDALAYAHEMTAGMVGRALAALAALGLIRQLDPDDPAERYATPQRRAAARALCAAGPRFEATRAGLTALADRVGLPLPIAVAQGGWSGGGPGRDRTGRALAIGDRGALAADLRHTDGVHRCCLALVEGARQDRRRREANGWSDAGADPWSDSGAADAAWWDRRRCGDGRADAEVGYARDGWYHEAFLLFDARGGDGEDDRQRFAADRRRLAALRDVAERALRDHPGDAPPPLTILVVARHAEAEARFLSAARAELVDAPVRVLLTTERRAIDDEQLLLGAIWLEPALGLQRRFWVEPAVSSARGAWERPANHPDWLAPLGAPPTATFAQFWARVADDDRAPDSPAPG